MVEVTREWVKVIEKEKKHELLEDQNRQKKEQGRKVRKCFQV